MLQRCSAATGNWSECMIVGDLRVHDGFDTRFSAAHDFCSTELFRLLASLVLRKVVRIWHFGLPCVSWGTLRRPRVGSKYRPFGFSPTDHGAPHRPAQLDRHPSGFLDVAGPLPRSVGLRRAARRICPPLLGHLPTAPPRRRVGHF